MANSLDRTQDSVAAGRNLDRKYQNQNDLRGNYNIGTLEYPEGLRDKPDLQHYVAFFINVRDKTTNSTNTGANNSKKEDKDYYVSADEQKRLDALQRAEGRLPQNAINSTAKTVADNTGKIVGALTFLHGVGTASRIRDVLTAGVRGLATGVVASAAQKEIAKLNLDPFTSSTTKRLKDVITLHVDERPSVKYGVNYSTSEISALAGIMIEGSANATAENIQGFTREAQGRFLTTLAQAPQFGAARGFINDIRELTSKTKTNPFRETLFESIDTRQFNFRYRFYPSSRQETEKVKAIIDKFKYHMYPTLTPNKLFYVYPAEFDIQYYFGDEENKYLHKFTKCALTDMQIDYGGEQFITFDNGAPAEIGMTLSFTELEQLNSQKVTDGY